MMDKIKTKKLLAITIGLGASVAVCLFEFFYLLFTHTAWAVLPFGIGVGSLVGLVVLVEMDKQGKLE